MSGGKAAWQRYVKALTAYRVEPCFKTQQALLGATTAMEGGSYDRDGRSDRETKEAYEALPRDPQTGRPVIA